MDSVNNVHLNYINKIKFYYLPQYLRMFTTILLSFSALIRALQSLRSSSNVGQAGFRNTAEFFMKSHNSF